MNTSLRTWLQYIDNLPWIRGSLDQSSWSAFLRAGSLGVHSRVAFQEVCQRIRAAGDHPRLPKLRNQLKRAFEFTKTAGALRHYDPNTGREFKPAFNSSFTEKFARQVPPITNEWLRRQSGVPLLAITPAEFLWQLYNFGERVAVFADQRSQGDIWSKDKLRYHRGELDRFISGHPDGVWFLPQPVDGLEHYNSRQDRMSRRSEESITSFRFAVLESDCQPVEQWLRILVQLPLPIVSITTSGGKSVHALVRVDAPSKVSWDSIVREGLLPRLVKLGADPQALTAVRLSRLPGCYRGERLQELLHFNPLAAAEPIWKGRINDQGRNAKVVRARCGQKRG